MTRDEAVQKLSMVARISVAYAEDLYDSFFPKPVVPQFVADWYEEHKTSYDYELWDYLSRWEYQKEDNFKKWIGESYETDKPIITLVNMHQFGYTVEGEPRYMVRIKGIDDRYDVLNHGTHLDEWTIDDAEGAKGVRTTHTRKELEANGFGWVFSCEGVEVKEVTDE